MKAAGRRRWEDRCGDRGREEMGRVGRVEKGG